jgi:CheY-like chemotaxis protein
MAKILLVEDEALIRVMAEEDLKDLGHIVIAVSSGDEACALMQSDFAFDVLITDIRMPGAVDGWELARRVRDAHPSMHIVYVSGFAGDNHAPVPDSHFIKKPYRLEQLSAAVESPHSTR